MLMNFDTEEDKDFDDIDEQLSSALPSIPVIQDINFDNLAKTLNALHDQVIYLQQQHYLDCQRIWELKSQPASETLRNAHEPKVSDPPEFSRKISEFDTFFAYCSLIFDLQPHTFTTDIQKVLYIIS